MGCLQWPTANCGDCNTLWQPLLKWWQLLRQQLCDQIALQFVFSYSLLYSHSHSFSFSFWHSWRQTSYLPANLPWDEFRFPLLPQGKTCRRGKYQKGWEGKGDKFGLAASSRFLPVFVETSLKVIQVVGQQCGQHPPVSVSRLQFWLAVCCHLLHAHACSVCALSVAPVADGGQLVSQISR